MSKIAGKLNSLALRMCISTVMRSVLCGGFLIGPYSKFVPFMQLLQSFQMHGASSTYAIRVAIATILFHPSAVGSSSRKKHFAAFRKRLYQPHAAAMRFNEETVD
jgi:hypothetical protein